MTVTTGPTSLSQAQRDVINHPLDKPGVVDAGAGTGKTFTIVERVAALHESGNCPADRILLLTFGRKAAAELRARIARRLGEAAPACQTFHAFAWTVLSSHLYDIGLSPETTIIEDVEARVEFKTAFDEFMGDPQAAASGFPLRAFNRDEIRDSLFAIRQNLKQQGISVESFRERAFAAAESFGRTDYRELRRRLRRASKGREFTIVARVSDEQLAQEVSDEKARVLAAADVFTRFDRRLADRHLLTYADILARAEDALATNPALREELRGRYRCCIVDEYQDTDLAQHRFLTALFGKTLERVMVVGDVLQSIYSFRGARPGNVDAIKAAPGSITYPLHENRRSLQAILDLAHHAVLPSHGERRPLGSGARERGRAARARFQSVDPSRHPTRPVHTVRQGARARGGGRGFTHHAAARRRHDGRTQRWIARAYRTAPHRDPFADEDQRPTSDRGPAHSRRPLPVGRRRRFLRFV